MAAAAGVWLSPGLFGLSAAESPPAPAANPPAAAAPAPAPAPAAKESAQAAPAPAAPAAPPAPQEKPAAPAEKPAEKAAAPAETATVKPADKPAENPAEKPAEKVEEKPAENPAAPTPPAAPVAAKEAAPPAAKPEAAPAAPVVQIKPPSKDEFRFQFDGVPYSEVIQRFAQMAGKPLLGDSKVVEGSLTFFDARPYTFDEAFDMLNLLLAMRGFTLIETPRYCQVVPLAGGAAAKAPLKILRGLNAASDVRAGEIVTMMLPLKFLSAEDAVKVLQPVISQFGSMAPLGRGRGIIITDRLENIRRIKVLLDEMDTSTLAPPGERSLRTYTLKNASARDVAAIINSVFGSGGLGFGGSAGNIARYIRAENGEWVKNPEWNPEAAAKAAAAPDTSVKCTADERTNTLFVAGPPDKLAMAEELILKLDQIRPEQTGDMRIFELKNAKAEDVAATLRQILTGSSRAPGEGSRYGDGYRSSMSSSSGMQTRVVADPGTNRLIVTAPLDQMKRIEDLIRELDQANLKYVGGIRVFPLKVADAQQLAGVLANALRKAGVQDSSGHGYPQPTTGTAQVSADTRTNSLIVAGSASDIQTAETLIRELDRPMEKDAREIHVVQLKAGDARQVAQSLMQLLRQAQEGGEGGYRRYGAPVASNVRVEAEPATNSLLISAAPGDWETIKKILDQIETSVIPQTTATTRLLPLKFAKAASLAETLNQIYSRRTRSSYGSYGGEYGRSSSAPQVPVVIAADERSNTLIVSAAEDDQKAIAELVRNMDVAGAETAEQIRVIHLKAGDAVKIADNIRGLYQTGGYGDSRGARGVQIFIQGDPASNSLLVRAPDTEFKVIEKLAADLDTAITQSGGIKTFRLKVADAQQLATVLQGALAKREGYSRWGSPPAQQTTVSADVRTNSVIVAGPAADIQTAETLIQELDKPLDASAREIHVVQLKSGDAQQVAQALTNLLKQGETTGRWGASVSINNIRIEAETATNSLLISAAPGDWPTIQKILDQLKDAASPLTVAATRLIPLKHAKASEVAETLRQVFSSSSGRSYGAYGTYGRRYGGYSSEASSSASHSTVPVVIAASDSNNSLIVTASEEDHKTIAELVKAMDVGSADGVGGIRMIQLKSADAAKLAETLKAMIPPPSRNQEQNIFIQADPISNTLLLRAPEADRKMFEEMIASLDKSSTQGARETRLIPLKNISAAALAQMLTQLYQQGASQGGYASYYRRYASSGTTEATERVTVAAAPGDRAIIVDAPRDKVEEIARLVTTLDVPGGAGETQVRTYRLVNAKAGDLAQSLGRLFEQRYRAGRSPSDTEVPPRFEADAATNNVIVAATVPQFETIEKLIKELESGTSLARETRTFRLKFAKAVEIVDVLQTMLAETPSSGGGGGRYGYRSEAAGAPETRVAAIAETNDIVVQGTPEKLALAEQLIKTFDIQGAESHTIIQIVQLKNAQAASLAESVNATLAESASPVSFGPRRGTRGAYGGSSGGGTGAAAGQADRVTVTPETNSNSVLVRGPAADVPIVVEMIRKLDEGSTSGGAQVRVFPLVNSEPTELAVSLGKLFQEMIRQQTGGYRGAGQSVPFSIAADERTRSLVVTTTPGYFALMEQILKQIDQAEGAPTADVQYVWLENADATEVASKLSDLYSTRKGPDKPVISADSFSNAVTIIAKDADLKAMEPIIQKLDDAAKDNNFRVRVIPLTQVKADKMAAVLKAVYSQLTGSEVNVTTEPSPPKPEAGGLMPVPDLSKPGLAPPPAKPSATPAPSAAPDPGENAPGGKDKPPKGRTRGGGKKSDAAQDDSSSIFFFKAPPPQEPKPGISIGVDKASNSLIITGKRQDLDYLESLINQLTPSSSSTEAEYRVFKIEKADPGSVARTLDSLFNPRALLLQRIQMQMGGGGQAARGGGRGGGGAGTPQPAPAAQAPQSSIIVVADVRTSSIIVRAKPMEFELIEPIIKHLDQIPTVASEIRIFALKNTDANEVAANLRDLFGLNQRQQQGQSMMPQQQGRQQTPQDQRAAMIRQMMELANGGATTQIDVNTTISITANRQTNSVVVAAPNDVMAIVERVIQELDQSGVTTASSVRLYPVKNAEVRGLVQALQDIFVTGAARQSAGVFTAGGGRGGFGQSSQARTAGTETPTVITGDEAGRLVIVSAPTQMHEVIAKVIKEMDEAQGVGEFAIKVYHLENADATSVAPALAAAIERATVGATGGGGRAMRGAGAGGGTGQTRITADRSSNSIIVRASAEDHQKIAQLISEMDATVTAVVRMYPLKNAEVRSTVTALQDIFGSGARVAAGGGRRGGGAGGAPAAADRGAVTISGDEAGRLVIVSAPEPKHELIATVIREIDSAQGAGDVSVKVYRLANADATTMALALQGTVDRGGQTAAGGGGGGARRGGGMQGGAAGAVRISADRGSNSLVVRASAADHEALAKLISEMDVSPTEQFAVRLIALNNADAANIAQVLTRIFAGVPATPAAGQRGPRGAVGQTAGPAGRSPVVIEADRNARMLMVRADDPTFEKIKALAQQLDAASTGALTTTVIPLKFAQAASVAPAISQAFGGPTRLFSGGRGAGSGGLPAVNPDVSVTVVAEPMSNSLLVTANAMNLEKVKGLLEKLDTEVAGGVRTELLILKNAKATDLAPTLSRMAQSPTTPGGGTGRFAAMMGVGGGAGAPGAVTVSADAASNGLVVSGPSADVDKILKMARDLDQATGEPLVKTYPIKNADVKAVVTALQELTRGGTGGGTAGGTRRFQGMGSAPTGGGSAADIVVTGDEVGRQVIVSAPKEKHELVARIIKEMDDAAGSDQLTVKIYRLSNADATTVGPALQAALERSQAAGGMGGVGGTRGSGQGGTHVRINADRSSNTLIVRASAEDHERVAKLLTEMDMAPTEQYAIRLIPLNTADATNVATVLTRLFTGAAAGASTGVGGRGAGAGPRPPVIIEADRDARMLMVRADDATFEKIEALAGKMDESSKGQAAPTVIPLKFAKADGVAPTLSAAFAPRAGAGGRTGVPANPDDLVTVVAEPMSNSLIVTANTMNLEKVNTLLAKLDTQTAGGLRTELKILKNAKANDVAPVLQKMVAAGGATGKAAPGSVSISADVGSNGIVVSGPSTEIDKVMKMVQEIDDATSSTASSVYVVALRNGDATEVAQMVRDLYAQQTQSAIRDKKSIDPLAVSCDTRSNAIVLATTKQMYEQVTQWVNQIETMAPSRGAVRIITLQHADPAELDKAIKQIFGPGGGPGSTTIPVRRGPGGEAGPEGAAGPAPRPAATSSTSGKVDTTVLPTQNSVLINASDEDFETIRKLAEALDAAAAESRRQVKVVPLKNAGNARVAQALTSMYRASALRPTAGGTPEEPVTVTALPDTNAVVVSAPRVRMEEVEHLIAELDKLEIAPQLEYRIYPMKNVLPTKVMPLLTQMLAGLRQLRPDEPINVQADERTRSLIVTARSPMFDQVAKIVETLDKEPEHAAVDVLIIPLKKADAPRLAAVLNEMLRPSATAQVTPEARALQEQIRLLRVRGPEGANIPELDLTKPIKVSADPGTPGGAGGGGAGAGGAAAGQGSNSLLITSTPDNLKAMKAIVEILDTVPLAEGTKVRILHLENADATAVEAVLKDVFTQGKTLAGKSGSSVAGRAEPESASGKALVNPLNVSADERTNTIVMSGLEESLALAEAIVKDLDRDSGKIVTEVRLFRLKYADVTRLLPVLQAVFAEGTAAAGGGGGTATTAAIEGLRTQVTRLRTVMDKEAGHTTEIPKTRAALTIQADPLSSIIVVAARSDMMPLIADVINTMDVPGAGAMNVVRIYPLTNADATRLKTVIDGLYTGPSAQLVRPEDKPVVQVDVRTNALVVSTSDKTFAMIESLLASLDAKQPIEMRDVRLVPLKNADAAALAPILQQMMDARVQRLTAIGQADAEALRVIVTADSRSNSLMVAGSTEGYELIKSLAQQLDDAGPAIIGQIQLMPLKIANAGILATTLTQLFTQRYAAARTPDIARQKPIILADTRVNALLIAANADDTKVIEGLLKRMDVEVNPSVELVLLPLKFNDAGIVGAEIQRIFAARLTSMTPPGAAANPQDRVDVGTDPLSNSLVVSASHENLTLIKGLLEKVDAEPPAETGIIKMYALQNSDATRIATLLQGLISQGLYKPGIALAAQQNTLLAAREKVAITADVRTNVLIVSASKENFAVIDEIIKKIDSTDDFGLLGDVRLFMLKNATSTRLAPTLQQLFTAKRAAEQAAGGTGRMLPVSVFADARTNALLVTGSKESFNAIEAMIRELDTDQVLAANEFRVFYLKQATAQVLAPTLTQLFAQRVSRGVPLDPVTVVIEQRTNSLIVAASPEDMKLAESLIARLDAEPDRPGTTVQVFPLVKADATQVSTTVNNLYKSGPGGAGAGATGGPQVVVSVDERINALIVSAGPADQKRIGELVRQLDADSVPRVTEIRVFSLENADATELTTILTAALNNKPVPLTATSPNRQTLLQFVSRTKEGGQLVSSALQEGVLINADKRTNSIVVSAPQENMSLLESLIKAMDSTTPRMAEIKVFQLQNGDARQMATVLLQLFRMQTAAGGAAPATGKQAIQYTLKAPMEGDKGLSATMGSAEEAALTVTVDIRTNSLLVGGTKRYVDLATKVIEDLDASAAEERLTEIYRLRNAQAADIQTAVASFLTQERTLLTQALSTGQGTSNYILDREVAIVAEPVTNTLLLSASPRYFDVIAQMIAELDQPPPQVLVQVLLAEVTIDDTTDFGMDWNFTHKFDNQTQTLKTGTSFGVAANLTPGFSVSVTGGDLSYFLRALQAQNRLEVLSRPQILASDNQKAVINIGQRVPFITNSRIDSSSGAAINTIQYQQIGIILNVIPRINPDGFVKLTVAPEISSLSDASVEISAGVKAVIINSRSAETTVTVQDGHTIVIGGLITTNDQNTEDKIPILGDIPILGWLFKTTHLSKQRTELLIILTPTVIRNVQEADATAQSQVKRLNLLRETKHDTMQKSLFKPISGGLGEQTDSSGLIPLATEPAKAPPQTPPGAPAKAALEPATGGAEATKPKEAVK
jgi:type II secretion system protein D